MILEIQPLEDDINILNFGDFLQDAPTTLMDLMNRVVKLYRDMFVIVFIDDILIYSRDEEYDDSHLTTIFKTMKDKELYVKFSYYEFF